MQPLIDGYKCCRVCKEVKPITQYHPNKQCRQGVTGTCKPCSMLRVAQWYKDNRDRRQSITNTRNRDRKKAAVEHFGSKCHDCQRVFPQCVYEFHHLDPKGKDMNPSAALNMSEERMWNELKKCIMVCSNCHKMRHFMKGGSDYAAIN